MVTELIDPARFIERREACGLSQTALGRRAGMSQQAISRIESGDVRESRRLHVLARELRTTPAYLTGQTEDPDEDAPPQAPPAQPERDYVKLTVALPPRHALARMFSALLKGIDRDLPIDEQAELLAQRLPIGLSQLRDLLPEPETAAAATPPAARPKRVRLPQ